MIETFLEDAVNRDFAAEEWDRLGARAPDELALAELEREVSVGELILQARMRAGQFIAQ